MRSPMSIRPKPIAMALRSRLTFANTISVVALFVALGGASYAAVSLPRNSVGTVQLRSDAVTSGKLAPASVRKPSLSPWIRDQLARRASDGSPGPTGERGPRGETGPRGPGAVPVRYSEAASDTPSPKTVLDIDGLSFTASCDESGGTITANFAARSAEAATLHETITVDSGLDPSSSGPAGFSGNLQIDLPAGVTLQTGGPSAAAGYTRVAVEGVYSAPSKTVDLHMFLTVDADHARCSINGVAVPA